MIRRFRVTVNGQAYDVTVEDEADAAATGAANPPAMADRGPAQPAAPLTATSPSAPAAPEPSGSAAGDQGVIAAPLPGVILDVKVRAGEHVAAGDVVLILEAMKMENEITSPVDGAVAEVRVSKGATVDLGQVLVVVA